MKLHGMKLLLVGTLVLVSSTVVFSRLANSLDKSAAQPQLATLASLYKSSDPYVLTTARTETEVGAPARVAEPTADTARINPIKIDFSPYVRLHLTRGDNLVQHEGID